MKRAVRKPMGSPVGETLIYWGIYVGRDKRPDALFSDPKNAKAVLAALGDSIRDRCTVLRTYVTIRVSQGRPPSGH